MTKAAPAGRSIRPVLTEGLAHHQAGRLPEAVRSYRRALAIDPANADGLHLLGLAALGLGDLPAATGSFRRLVAVRPASAEYRSKLGHVLRLGGDPAGAESECRTATELDPAFVDGWINLGLARLDRGDGDGAVAALETALALAPGSAVAHLNLGSVWQQRARYDEAARHYRAAVAIDPSLHLGHRNLAVVAHLAGDWTEAEAGYRQALELEPADPDLLTNLGVILTRADRLADALDCHDRAVAAGPDLGEAWLNRGTCLQALGRLDDALDSYARAAALDPGPKPRTAAGNVLAERGDFAGAEQAHRAALAIDPDFTDGHWNLSLALLGQGKVGPGFEEYEWRWRASSRPAELRAYPWPAWSGQPLDGKSILVWREQGLGDELLFLTCLGDLVATGARITALVSPRLVTLVARAFPTVAVRPDQTLTDGESFGYHVPLGSLPRWLRPDRSAFDGQDPWLAATGAEWDARLATIGGGPKVGICWRSGLVTAERRRHYPDLDDWRSIWRVPGIRWVNLQYDECDAELAQIEETTGLRIHRWPGVDLRNDLEGVVGLLGRLDAVVTAPTAVSSLAGAVGVPTWQLDSGTDWTAFGEERSPWFPSIRLVRRSGSWPAAVDRLANELTSWVHDWSGR